MFFGKSMNTALMAATALVAASSVQAATVPFTEDFAADNANWKDAAGADLSFVATGGPDGSSYVSTPFSFANANTDDDLTVLRGQDNFDSSADAFVGNWIADGVTTLTMKVRHNGIAPINFFVRLASPFNFPGAAAIDFVPVLPNTWTEVSFDVTSSSIQLITFEGSDYNTVFSNIGNIQLGVRTPAAMAGFTAPVTFDLDQPTITPEPASLALLGLGGLAMLRRR